MKTIVCVLKSGGDFKPEHVETLQRQVARHTTLEHRFVCLTDTPEKFSPPVYGVPLLHNWPGWWSKVELFRLEGRVFYLDLDTAIAGNIDAFLEREEDFIALKPFRRKWGIASGLMAFDARPSLYESFRHDPDAAIRMCRMEADPPWNNGDQRYLELRKTVVDYWQDLLPGQVVSYRHDCLTGLPEDARIVCFSGNIRPWQVEEEWIRSLWK